MLVDSKSFLKSGTVWAGIATIAATIANTLGYHVTDADTQTAIHDVSQIVQALGGLAAIYFRIKATKTLTIGVL